MMAFEQYQQDVRKIADSPLGWDALSGKTILMTGASGMIGSFLVDVLMLRNQIYGDDIKLYAVSRDIKKAEKRWENYLPNGLQPICWDVEQPPVFTGHFDFMIHGASNTHPVAYASDPVGTIGSNVLGLMHLLQYAIKEKPERVLMVSSVEIYGENSGKALSFSEKDLGYIDCNTVRAGYPESKRLAEALCRAYDVQYGITSVIGRLSRVYGPTVRPDDSKALSQFIKKAVAGENIVLKSDGHQYYSYTYVADAAAALLLLLTKGKAGEAYNIADPASDITLRELAQKLAAIAGTSVVFEVPNATEKAGYSTATRAILNAEKIREIGFRSCFTLEEGLQHTVEILKEQGKQDEGKGVFEGRVRKNS